MNNTLFKGLKVIELASVLAGPAVGLFFAELGAEVIKIENKKTGGDVTRKWKHPNEVAEAAYSAYYCAVNWNKTVQFTDLGEQMERAKVYELITEADIVISNFKPTSAKKMGMDADTLRAKNPRLIFAELTGYGQDDPRLAFDVVLQAEAGFLYMCGEADGASVKMPVALIDLLAAHQLKEGILVALLQRAQTGKGSTVRTSLFEAAVASLANQATNWLMAGHIPQKMGMMHPNIAPYGDVFKTKDDKEIVLAVGTEKQWQILCKLLNSRDLINQSIYQKNAHRVANRVQLREDLAPAFLQFEREELLALFHKNGVPAGSIRDMKEVFELPMAQAMILEEKMADGRVSKRVKSVAFELS